MNSRDQACSCHETPLYIKCCLRLAPRKTSNWIGEEEKYSCLVLTGRCEKMAWRRCSVLLQEASSSLHSGAPYSPAKRRCQAGRLCSSDSHAKSQPSTVTSQSFEAAIVFFFLTEAAAIVDSCFFCILYYHKILCKSICTAAVAPASLLETVAKSGHEKQRTYLTLEETEAILDRHDAAWKELLDAIRDNVEHDRLFALLLYLALCCTCTALFIYLVGLCVGLTVGCCVVVPSWVAPVGAKKWY